MSAGKRMSDEHMDEPCERCGEPIDGDVMSPEGAGPMHPECWTDWIDEQ